MLQNFIMHVVIALPRLVCPRFYFTWETNRQKFKAQQALRKVTMVSSEAAVEEEFSPVLPGEILVLPTSSVGGSPEEYLKLAKFDKIDVISSEEFSVDTVEPISAAAIPAAEVTLVPRPRLIDDDKDSSKVSANGKPAECLEPVTCERDPSTSEELTFDTLDIEKYLSLKHSSLAKNHEVAIIFLSTLLIFTIGGIAVLSWYDVIQRETFDLFQTTFEWRGKCMNFRIFASLEESEDPQRVLDDISLWYE